MRSLSARAALLALPVLAGLLLLGAGCGDDDDEAPAAPATTLASTPAELPDACDLVPGAAEVSGLQLGEGVPDGDERRRVCAFAADGAGATGLTVAVQGGSRFDEKAEQSARTLGDDGEDLPGLGDRARFFFSDEDLPEGVGGVLVEVGERTIEVTLQGLDEARMREAGVALARLATEQL